jgi:hypothetical protein
MEDDLRKKEKNGRRPQKMEKNGRQPNFFVEKTRMTTSKKWEMT